MALPLLGSMLIGVVVASDLENRTVHDRLLAASRSALVAVKTVMALVVAVVVLLPYVAGSLVCLATGCHIQQAFHKSRHLGSDKHTAKGFSLWFEE